MRGGRRWAGQGRAGQACWRFLRKNLQASPPSSPAGSGHSAQAASPARPVSYAIHQKVPCGHAQGFGNFSWFFFYSLLHSMSLNFGFLLPLYNNGFVVVVIVGLFLAYLRGFPKFFAVVSGQNTWCLSLNTRPMHTRVPPCPAVSPVAVSLSGSMCQAAPLDQRPAMRIR